MEGQMPTWAVDDQTDQCGHQECHIADKGDVVMDSEEVTIARASENDLDCISNKEVVFIPIESDDSAVRGTMITL